jgi:hypothetical protein
MASIFELPGRKLPWRAQVKRKGHRTEIKHFLTKEEAEHWAGELERNIRLTGLPMLNTALRNVTVMVKRETELAGKEATFKSTVDDIKRKGEEMKIW